MEKFLTAEELAAALGVKITTIYSWTHQKKIPRANCRLLRFEPAAVQNWLSKSTEKPLKAPEAAARPKAMAKGKGSSEVTRIVSKAISEVLG